MTKPKRNQPKKARLIPLQDGPLLYENEVNPEGNVIYDWHGNEISCEEPVCLCRCGGSADKLFCDGTHVKIGFSGRKESDGSVNGGRDYAGKRITIHDNRYLCSHAGFCWRELPAVFRKEARPWIDPDAADPEDIIAVIEKCPSGALSYSIDGVEQKDPERKPAAIVAKDGPYCLVGGIEVVGCEPRAESVSTEHCCCCRCGSSKNKPFCDGSHDRIDFKDAKD
ncbi:MAG: hypothetical protein A2W01_11595 [Candidatus Solincola sediminis]|nr:MAG: hypothetical protein A2W01_11595 [Candidatus Solincola sediminis]